MSAEIQSPAPLERDPALTGLRALAIGLVLLSHMAIAHGLPRPWMIKGSGQLGVMLFFLLSGFLMARIYGRARPDRAWVRRFVVARAGRVLPAYLVVIAVSVIVARFDPTWPYQITDAGTVLRHVLMIEGQNALWAVPVEVQFYAVFLVAWLLGRGHLFPAIVAIGLPVSAVLAYSAALPGLGARPLAAYVPYFLTGSALGLWLPARPRGHWALWWGISAIAGLAILLSFPYLRRHFGFDLPIWRDPVVYGAMVLVFVAAIWRAGAFALLANPLLVWVGTISYGLYLWNPIALHMVSRWGSGGVVVTPALMLGLSVIFAVISWALIEKPCLRWARAQLPQVGRVS